MRPIKKQIFQAILLQAIVLAIAFLLFMPFSAIAAFSLLLGGLCCALPNACFALYLFIRREFFNARHFLTRFHTGEVMKLLLVACLCVMVFKSFAIKPLEFFTGFFLAQVTFWVASWRTFKPQSVRGQA